MDRLKEELCRRLFNALKVCEPHGRYASVVRDIGSPLTIEVIVDTPKRSRHFTVKVTEHRPYVAK